MSLDIALPPALSASGGPPGAGPPTPADLGQAFAALLAQQGLPTLSRPAAKSPAIADETRDELARTTKPDNKAKSDKDAEQDGDDNPVSTDLSLVSQTTLPPETAIPAAIFAAPGPPVPFAPSTTAANIDSTSEAMDTRPASTPASQGGTDLISGGELLPQFAQPQSPTAEHAPASALPNAPAPPASVALVNEQDRKSAGPATAGGFSQGTAPAAGVVVSQGQVPVAAAKIPTPAAQDLSAVPVDVSQTPLNTTLVAPALPAQKSASSKTLPSQGPIVAEANFTGSTDVAAAPSRTPLAADPPAAEALPTREAGAAATAVPVSEKASSPTAPALTEMAGSKSAQSVTATQDAQSLTATQAVTATEAESATLPTASLSAGNVMPVSTSLLAKAQMDTPAFAATLPATVPDPVLSQSTNSQSTKTALQSYAQFAQNTLQNPAQPANNTGSRGNALAVPGKGVLEQSISPASVSQTQLPLTLVPTHAAETLQKLTRQGASQDDTEKDKSEVSSSQAFSELLTPTNSQTMETKTATVSTTAPLTAQGRAALTEQAAASMQAMHAQAAKSGHGQMTLQLYPQDWGKLQVSVTMAASPSGTVVTAHLVADSPAVKHALEASGTDLKRTLRDAGLHLDNFTVTVRPAAAGSEAQTTGGNGKQNASPNPFGASTPGNRGEGAASTAAGNGGTAFGGNGTSGQGQTSRQPSAATPLITAPTDEPEEQTTRAATNAARRLDTRA